MSVAGFKSENLAIVLMKREWVAVSDQVSEHRIDAAMRNDGDRGRRATDAIPRIPDAAKEVRPRLVVGWHTAAPVVDFSRSQFRPAALDLFPALAFPVTEVAFGEFGNNRDLPRRKQQLRSSSRSEE